MRVLWITNQPIGAAAKRLSFSGASGTWMDPPLYDLMKNPEIQLSVAFICNVHEWETFSEENVDYYCIPRGKKAIYDFENKNNMSLWEKTVRLAAPDVMMVWGTEYTHSLCAIRAAEGIPTVVLMQGIITAIERHYLGGLSEEELKKTYSLRNFLKGDSIKSQKRSYKKRAEYEKEMLQRAGNVIVESDWAAAMIKGIAPNCQIHTYRLNNKAVFFEKEWEAPACRKRSVFCTAPVGYPLKGFHILLKAMAIVCRQYPDAVLRVPGMSDPFGFGFMDRIKRPGYTRYIMQLIEKNDLRKNIQFLGRLNSDQMAEELVKANVFVTPSSIENHSVSLREAMAVGVPCVASYVGGVPEVVEDGKTGRLYRFEEYEQLADIILNLMDNSQKAAEMGRKARQQIGEYLSRYTSSDTLIDIYKKMLAFDDGGYIK